MVRFPAGSIRAAVLAYGDAWAVHECRDINGEDCYQGIRDEARDIATMTTCARMTYHAGRAATMATRASMGGV